MNRPKRHYDVILIIWTIDCFQCRYHLDIVVYHIKIAGWFRRCIDYPVLFIYVFPILFEEIANFEILEICYTHSHHFCSMTLQFSSVDAIIDTSKYFSPTWVHVAWDLARNLVSIVLLWIKKFMSNKLSEAESSFSSNHQHPFRTNRAGFHNMYQL